MAGSDTAKVAGVEGGLHGGSRVRRVSGADWGLASGEVIPAGPSAYLEETWHAMAGWLRVIGGYSVSTAGSLVRNDHWRRRGVRARLVGTVQCRLGASAAAIERLVGRGAERRERPAPGIDERAATRVGTR
jgi:hypothetical protein